MNTWVAALIRGKQSVSSEGILTRKDFIERIVSIETAANHFRNEVQ